MAKSLYEYCIEKKNEALLSQWHPEKNGDLHPEDVAKSSQKKIWWVCENGHEWETTVASRTNQGTGCPVCARLKKRSSIGKSLYRYCVEKKDDTLLSQWHPTKNGELTPKDVSHGSNRKVWWICEKGHEWEAMVNSRTNRRTGCPVCARDRFQTIDLATSDPEIAKQWHPTKNGDLQPTDVTRWADTKVWWVCEKGHEWEGMVYCRIASGCGCPICTMKRLQLGVNDLATTNPEIAKQWHPDKNGALQPTEVTSSSHKKVWWICEKKHEWEAAIKHRTRQGTGCPICKNRIVVEGINDLTTTHPEIAKEWHPTKNGDLQPTGVARGTNKKVWWICEKGHAWEVNICTRTFVGTGCPVCQRPKKRSRMAKSLYEYCVENKNDALLSQWNIEKNGELTPKDVS